MIRSKLCTARGRKFEYDASERGKERPPRREQEVYKISKKGKQSVSLGLSSVVDLHAAKTRQTRFNRPLDLNQIVAKALKKHA